MPAEVLSSRGRYDEHADPLRPAPGQRLQIGSAAPGRVSRAAAGCRQGRRAGRAAGRRAGASSRSGARGDGSGQAVLRGPRASSRRRRVGHHRSATTTTRLIEPWLASRGADSDPGPLRLEQLLEPAEVSATVTKIAEWCSPARLRVAYPGIWIRDDVYAMHGHYLDCHLTVPTLERLSVGVMSRLLRRPASSFAGVEDYEAMGAPVFAWRDAVARGCEHRPDPQRDGNGDRLAGPWRGWIQRRLAGSRGSDLCARLRAGPARRSYGARSRWRSEP